MVRSHLCLTAAIAALGLALVTSCGSREVSSGGGAPASQPPVRSCATLHFPFPPAAANLAAPDSGRVVEVSVGDLVAVTLVGARAPGGRWPEISVSGVSLRALVNTANAATVGTQLGEYCAVRAGTTTLASGAWQATVKVR